jgi:hypothetical protein
LQLAQLDGQQVVVPVGQIVGLVVCDAIRLDLLRRQIPSDVDRRLFQAELERGLVTRVADDDDVFGVHHDGLAKAEFAD